MIDGSLRTKTLAPVECSYGRLRVTSRAGRIIDMTTMLELMAYCILELFAWCLADKSTKSLWKDYRDDPVYNKNVQDRIERSRMFEEPSE
jgi:hypothetical protein